MRAYRIIALFLPLLASCEKELDFHYHDVESQLVVEGNTSDKGTNVILTYTCPMGGAMDLTPITDAKVLVTDLNEGVSHELIVNSKGAYTYNSPGIPGHEYQLEISRSGSKFISESVMLQATKILGLEFQWIKMPYDYVAVLRIAFLDLPSADTCYWIKLYRNGEPYQWILSDDRASVNGIISEVTMTTRKNPDDENDKNNIVDGDEIKVVVNPISRGMYDYLIAIQSDSNGPKMFVGDYCLGYYMASSETSSSIIFHPNEITEYK